MTLEPRWLLLAVVAAIGAGISMAIAVYRAAGG